MYSLNPEQKDNSIMEQKRSIFQQKKKKKK